MATPICLGWPYIHFDGLLAHLQRRELAGQNYYTLPSKEVVRGGTGGSTPIDQLGPIWRGSVSFFQPEELHTMMIYKRFHTPYAAEMPWKRKYIYRGSGPLRDWMIRLPYIPAETVTFYGHGNLQETLRLLSFLPGLGKKTVYGFGAFRSVEVEELQEDRSVVWEGRAMRPIPLSMLEHAEETINCACYPPYWDKHSVTECARPGSHVKLKARWRLMLEGKYKPSAMIKGERRNQSSMS